MAEKLTKAKVVAGRLIPVKNLEKKAAANEDYFACWVEDADGGNERCLLLTEYQIEAAEDRANRNPEDVPEKGLLTDLLD